MIKNYILPGMIQDFKKFSFIEKFAVIIDIILNPRAVDYPIATYAWETVYEMPKGHIFTFYFKNNKIVYLRWL